MSSLRPDPTSKIHPEPPLTAPPVDHFDNLPDPLLLLIFNNIGDVKSLGRCGVVSKRFHALIPQVQNVVVHVDCVISDDDATSASDKTRGPFSTLFKLLFTGIFFKPFQAIQHILKPKTPSPSTFTGDRDGTIGVDNPGSVNNHHSPTQVLKNFTDLRHLKIELPAGELSPDDDVLLKWRAEFGSTLENCVILGASSVVRPETPNSGDTSVAGVCRTGTDDAGSIPESFYTNGGLKLRVVWTISSLIAAAARHYLLQPIISGHGSLETLMLKDVESQGVLWMNKDQLKEFREKPLSASSASKRTLVPALNMRLWYAPVLEMPDGSVLKGATLVAIRPSEGGRKDGCDGAWVSSAFEEPYRTAAKMLVKRRTYCLEMNSF